MRVKVTESKQKAKKPLEGKSRADQLAAGKGKLKPFTRKLEEPSSKQRDGLADILARGLNKRRQDLGVDEDAQPGSENDDDWDTVDEE